jgi:predicted enzyme related to lactoylglutathione lyase
MISTPSSASIGLTLSLTPGASRESRSDDESEHWRDEKERTLAERTECPPGVPCWVDTEQPDPQAAADFYGGLFGWDFEDRMPADHPGNYFVAKLRGLDVAAVSSPMDPSAPARWSTYVAVESADNAAGKVLRAATSDRLTPGRRASVRSGLRSSRASASALPAEPGSRAPEYDDRLADMRNGDRRRSRRKPR